MYIENTRSLEQIQLYCYMRYNNKRLIFYLYTNILNVNERKNTMNEKKNTPVILTTEMLR